MTAGGSSRPNLTGSRRLEFVMTRRNDGSADTAPVRSEKKGTIIAPKPCPGIQRVEQIPFIVDVVEERRRTGSTDCARCRRFRFGGSSIHRLSYRFVLLLCLGL